MVTLESDYVGNVAVKCKYYNNSTKSYSTALKKSARLLVNTSIQLQLGNKAITGPFLRGNEQIKVDR